LSPVKAWRHRGPKIVRELADEQGIGVKGLILISPVLDFREYSGSSLLQYVASLPTWRRRAREEGLGHPPPTGRRRTLMRGAISWADLVKGPADTEATTRLADAGGGIDRDRPGRQPQAGWPLRGFRVPARIRPAQRQGDGTLRRVVSGFDP